MSSIPRVHPPTRRGHSPRPVCRGSQQPAGKCLEPIHHPISGSRRHDYHGELPGNGRGSSNADDLYRERKRHDRIDRRGRGELGAGGRQRNRVSSVVLFPL